MAQLHHLGAAQGLLAAVPAQHAGRLSADRQGEPGQPLTQQELQNLPKEDLTGLVSTRDEPFNEFVASRKGEKPILVRTKTSLLKFELFKDKHGATGEPMIWVNHNTAHSVSELNTGDIYSV
jgi:hypothetical protein